jgi:hypothetical protein
MNNLVIRIFEYEDDSKNERKVSQGDTIAFIWFIGKALTMQAIAIV